LSMSFCGRMIHDDLGYRRNELCPVLGYYSSIWLGLGAEYNYEILSEVDALHSPESNLSTAWPVNSSNCNVDDLRTSCWETFSWKSEKI